MKKYVNGKIVEMTESDIERKNFRSINHQNRKNTSDYEARIKDLENTVETLLAKLSEVEQ